MGEIFTDAARGAAQEAFEKEHETRWDQLSDGYQDELIQEAQVKIDAEHLQYRPTKPTDEETKAGIRKVFMDIAAEKNFTDQEYIDFIDNSVEEMFVIMKKSFG
jgi:hydroxylamine reductase (hybrid-cluster protein)